MGARLRRDAQSFISAFLVRNVRRRLLDPSPPPLELEFGGGGAGKGKIATFDGIYAMTSHHGSSTRRLGIGPLVN